MLKIPSLKVLFCMFDAVENFLAQNVLFFFFFPLHFLSLFLTICKQARGAQIRRTAVLSTEISLLPFKDTSASH